MGDLSSLRTSRTQNYIKEADQVVIVVNERGILENVTNFLADFHLISQILTYDEIPQLTIVGTRLDERVMNLTDQEIEELQIHNDDGTEMLRKVSENWQATVSAQWRKTLMDWGQATLGEKASEETTKKVEKILGQTEIIPSTPKTYLRLMGLESDRWNLASRLCKTEECTGVPQVQESIYKLVQWQEILLSEQIKTSSKSLLNWNQATIESILPQMKAAVESSEEMSRFWVKFNRKLNTSKKWKIKTSSGKSLQRSIETDIKKGWADLDSDTLYKLLEPYRTLHYHTLMAALRRFGLYKSKGKSGVFVNIPGQIGAYVTEPIILSVKNFYAEVVGSIQGQLQKRLEYFIEAIRKSVYYASPQTSPSSIKEFAESLLRQLKQHENEIFRLSKSISFEEPELIETIYSALGFGMLSIMKVAEDESGDGARDRAINDIALLTPKMLPSIAKDTAAKIVENISEGVNKQTESIQESVVKLEKQTLSIILEKEHLVKEMEKDLRLKPKLTKLNDILDTIKTFTLTN